MPETPEHAPARWVNELTAAQHVGVTTRTIRRWGTDGTITRGGIGGVARYDLNELDAILRNGGTPPPGAGATAADALAKVRKALTPAGTQQLIHITRINAALDDIADELGVSAETRA